MNKYAVLTLIFWVLGNPVQAAPLPIVEFSRHFEGVSVYASLPKNPLVTSMLMRHLNGTEQELNQQIKNDRTNKQTVFLSKKKKQKLVTFIGDSEQGHYLIEKGKVEGYVLSDFFNFSSYTESKAFVEIKSLPLFRPAFMDQLAVPDFVHLTFHSKETGAYTEMYCVMEVEQEHFDNLTYLVLDAFYPSALSNIFEQKVEENVRAFVGAFNE